MSDALLNLPLKVCLSFLLVTEALFWIGPIKYPIENDWQLIFYLLIVNLALLWGYRKGLKAKISDGVYIGLSAIKILIFLGVVLEVASMSYMWASKGLSISIDTFVSAILDPGQAYHSSNDSFSSSTTFLSLFGPFAYSAIPLGILYWKKLSKFFRTLVVTIILLDIMKWLGIGTRKGIIDIMIISFFSILASNLEFFANKKNLKRIIPYIASLIFVFIVYFVYSNLSRSGLGMDEMDMVSLSFENRALYDNLPVWVTFPISSLTSYFTQGYYALALSLDMGILPLAPGGSSWFLINFAKKLGSDPTTNTYMYILQSSGIDMEINWHTAYVWLANDITFIGVPFFVYFVGYLFAKTWKESVWKSNDFSFILMTLFATMVLYFFANNQVFSSAFLTFFLWLFVYLLIPSKQI